VRLGVPEFERALARAIVPEDRVVVMFSGIWTFGPRFDAPPDELPRILLDAILRHLGPGRTLLLPTYTYAYTRTRRYDPATARPETGVLPTEFLFGHPSRRTPSAMNSYAVAGPDTAEVMGLRGASLWGAGSVMEWLEQRNARLCVLGLPWEKACAFLHRMEEVARVPYRYYKRFPGAWVEDGQERPWTERMYVRSLVTPARYRWETVSGALRAAGRIRSGSDGLLLESALAGDIAATGLELLAHDPYALLTNPGTVRDWVRDGKAAEIAALPAEERDP
jgi:aminoglycoside 3-N-acetyltransferase